MSIATETTISTWKPEVKQETKDLLQSLTKIGEEDKKKLLEESIEILARCKEPSKETTESTGLVLGYVQSGKTASFTTVAALARDNGYQIVVVITGRAKPLFHQSSNRLKIDLRLAGRDDRVWFFLDNPNPASNTSYAGQIKDKLAEWKDTTVPAYEKQTILITVMKHPFHLENLAKILEKCDVKSIPTLIIDDEADEASMNALVNEDQESVTYRKLLDLRELLSNNSYLEYTATPQAPLLIEIIDSLSPSFARVLTPGSAYTGGKEFFTEKKAQLVREIPEEDLPGNYEEKDPPTSLIQALRVFVLGVAAGYVEEGGRGNRSMMVHPATDTDVHMQYSRWVEMTLSDWKTKLESNGDKTEVLSEFEEAYQDLAGTVAAALPSKDKIYGKLLHALRNIRQELINSTDESTIEDLVDWRSSYGFVLVGGQSINRGFTVEGLTVTYMPRGAGVKNIDSIQQRARFFGYRLKYLGYCRVYLETEVIGAYENYVAHEENIRKQLAEHGDVPLNEWKRAFFMDPDFNATRSTVLALGFRRGDFSSKWYYPRSPHESEQALEENRKAITEFKKDLKLITDPVYGVHDVALDCQIADVYEKLLTRVVVTSLNDSRDRTGLLLQIKSAIDEKVKAICDVYFIKSRKEDRERTVDNGKLNSLFGGAYDVMVDKQKKRYPGESKLKSDDRMIVEIFGFDINDGDDKVKDVPIVAVHLPKSMKAPFMVQKSE